MQNTSDEMRVSDVSSDVCSSDLGRIVAEEVERAAMIFASFGAASGDMPPRIFVAGAYLVGIDALKLKGVGAADFAQGENAPVLPVGLSVIKCGFAIMCHVTDSFGMFVAGEEPPRWAAPALSL